MVGGGLAVERGRFVDVVADAEGGTVDVVEGVGVGGCGCGFAVVVVEDEGVVLVNERIFDRGFEVGL